MLNSLSHRERKAVEHYDNLAKQGDLADAPVWVDSFTGRIFRNLGDDDEVVDIGCRIGRFIPLLPELGIRRYFGIDPSEESINFCRREFSIIHGPNMQFEVGEARTLGTLYPDRFSGFILAAVLMHIPRDDLQEVLKSIRRSLKEGAPGFISTPGRWGDEFDFVNRHGMELTLYTMKELNEALIAAGFGIFGLFTPDDHMILAHVIAI